MQDPCDIPQQLGRSVYCACTMTGEILEVTSAENEDEARARFEEIICPELKQIWNKHHRRVALWRI